MASLWISAQVFSSVKALTTRDDERQSKANECSICHIVAAFFFHMAMEFEYNLAYMSEDSRVESMADTGRLNLRDITGGMSC